ncbi:MAG: hypothetical protein HY905_26230 [Deltaproteobacteria bacterium]|nr:hypothetical protein [Deltaproteobacteria bacterium]
MKKYDSKSSSPARIICGIEVDAGLRGIAATIPLADDFARRRATRRGPPGAARLACLAVVVRTRATVRISEFHAEHEIRSFARILQASEDGRRGTATMAVFPGGLNAVLIPRRAGQSRELRLLIERCGSACRRAGT